MELFRIYHRNCSRFSCINLRQHRSNYLKIVLNCLGHSGHHTSHYFAHGNNVTSVEVFVNQSFVLSRHWYNFHSAGTEAPVVALVSMGTAVDTVKATNCLGERTASLLTCCKPTTRMAVWTLETFVQTHKSSS